MTGPLERLAHLAGEAPTPNTGRPFADLGTTGLLWLINRTTFHPRGFALGIEFNENGQAIGWRLFGDGSEQWTFGADVDEDAKFAAVERLFAAHRNPTGDTPT